MWTKRNEEVKPGIETDLLFNSIILTKQAFLLLIESPISALKKTNTQNI